MGKKSKLVMLTIGQTSESSGARNFKRYIGIGASHVIAVNPSKDELDQIYGRDMKEPEYVSEKDGVRQCSVQFILKTDPDKCGGVETVTRAVFTLRDRAACNHKGTKVQCIDKYGNTAWASVEDVRQKKPLTTAAGNRAGIGADYRPACSGEADLVTFLKVYLNVPSALKYNKETHDWSLRSDAEAAKGLFSLEHVKDYFKGDFSEVRSAVALQPKNTVKMLYGVRTSEDNKQYQTVCTRGDMILPSYADGYSYERLEKRLAEAKKAGSWPNTEYQVCELKEYEVKPTDFSSPAPGSMPDDGGSEADDIMPWD